MMVCDMNKKHRQWTQLYSNNVAMDEFKSTIQQSINIQHNTTPSNGLDRVKINVDEFKSIQQSM